MRVRTREVAQHPPWVRRCGDVHVLPPNPLTHRTEPPGQLGEPAMFTIHVVPNWSTHIPNVSPHICCSRGTATVPPSASLSHQPRSLSASSPLRLTLIVLPGVWSIPGGVSAPMRVKPSGVSSMPCMIMSAPGALGSPYWPNVLMLSSPPKTPW